MPIAATLSGSMAKDALGGAAAGGTMEAQTGSSSLAGGTLQVDRSEFLAFYSRLRLTRPDVYLDDHLMPNLVETVEITESLEDPIQYATFTLADKRVALFDPDTVSDGDRTCRIVFNAGPPGSVKPWTAFMGKTETSDNRLPYRPRGAFRAVSKSADWADAKGCVNFPAFSGMTRGEILAAYAESAGVTISNAASLGGGVVRKPVDIAGLTVFELVKKFGELEGWFARSTDDGEGLEVLNEDQFLAGSPLFYFDESVYFDVAEELPDRPVTEWVLSTTRIKDPATTAGVQGVMGGVDTSEADQSLVVETTETAGVDALGRATLVRTEVTTNLGAEVLRVVTSWATVSAPGETPGPEVFQIVERFSRAQTWQPFHYHDEGGSLRTRPSTVLLQRTTTHEVLTGIPAAAGHGYLWSTGGRFTTSFAMLLVMSTTNEVFTWGECALLTAQKTTSGYYARLADRTGGSVLAFSDGSYRYAPEGSYSWLTVEESATEWVDLRQDANPRSEARITLSKWYAPGRGVSGDPEEIYGPFSRTTKVFEGNGSNTYYAVTESNSGPDGSETSTTSDPLSGAVPGPPSGSADVPLFEQEVVLVRLDATAVSGWSKKTESPPTYDFTESVDDLKTIARRKIRRDFADTLRITHRTIPRLRVGDHVAVTNRARSLVEKDAYVFSISRTAATVNAAMRQVTVVKIPPDWI